MSHHNVFPISRHSRYNMISPMESPVSYFNGRFGSSYKYETEADIQNALTRMGLLQDYVRYNKCFVVEEYIVMAHSCRLQ